MEKGLDRLTKILANRAGIIPCIHFNAVQFEPGQKFNFSNGSVTMLLIKLSVQYYLLRPNFMEFVSLWPKMILEH